jgi:hypothetical protein
MFRVSVSSRLCYILCFSVIQTLCSEVDDLTPRVIETSKYVALGDREEVENMHCLVDEWCAKVSSGVPRLVVVCQGQ